MGRSANSTRRTSPALGYKKNLRITYTPKPLKPNLLTTKSKNPQPLDPKANKLEVIKTTDDSNMS